MPARNVTNQAPRILSLWQGAWIAALAVGLPHLGADPLAGRSSTGASATPPACPPQTRYNLPIEVFYTVVPIIMIAVFFYFTARDERQHHARQRTTPTTRSR